MIYSLFETARKGFTALPPTEAKQLIMGEFGRKAGIKQVLALAILLLLLGTPIVLSNTLTQAQASLEITFDRQLSGDRVGQHKVPPLSPVNMTITVTVSSQVDNAVLIDYSPSDWTVTDPNGGVVSVLDENYNKIEWNVGAVSDSVSGSYVVRSPQPTSPPTKYYFRSELTYNGGSATSGDWMVIVADPPDQETLRPNAAGTYQEWDLNDTSHWGATSDQTDTTYIYTNVDEERDIQNLDDPTFGDSDTINWVQINFRAYASGSGGPEKAYNTYRVDGTDYQDVKHSITRDSWNDYMGSQLTGPGGMGSWTKAQVAALEAGARVDTVGGTEQIRISEIWVVVNYTHAAQWNLIETWTGTVQAPAQWYEIETWTGTIQAPAAWQEIETWTGTVNATAQWYEIETWTGTVNAPIQWRLIKEWTGTVNAPAQWYEIETWTGTVNAPAQWQLIETWTGTVQAPAAWHVIETWTGTVSAPVAWQEIETWTGTVSAPVQWQLIETWMSTVASPAQWQIIETWMGTVGAPAQWYMIETWTGTVQAPAAWQLIVTWTGTVEAPAAWQLIETWTGTVNAPAEWQLIETWTGTVQAPAAWQIVETWTGTVQAPAAWQVIETWTGTVSAPVVWRVIETWTGTVQASAAWQLIETWTGTVNAPAAWQVIETWTGTISAPVAWQVIETWTGTVEAPAEWQVVESWTGTVEAPAAWQLIETWTGTIEAPAAWQLIESWTGTVQAPAAWQVVETWTGTVTAPAEWQLVETWTGTIQAPAVWQLIEMWTGVVEAPAEWQLIETWTGTVKAIVWAVDVSVSPSWQENIAGGSLNYAVIITNLGEATDNLNMSVSDTLGWGLSLDNTRFEDVENGGSRSTTLRVMILSTALPSQTDNITVTATSERYPSKSDSENCQAHVALLRDVEVAISPSWQENWPGETLWYIVTVKNTGYLVDNYNLIASDNLGWALEISPKELWLEAGENDIASLSVTIPLETVSSITDVITVRAEGTLAEGTSTDPENVSAEATAEAHCTVIRDVDVSISPSYQSGLPWEMLSYTVTVTNTGTALDTYDLAASDNTGWSPIVSPSSIALSRGASGNATLKVIVPSDATRCTRDNITVTATSQENAEVSANASCIAHAVTKTSHDPIHIVGNENFTQANGVISGSGTLEDPYIIGYWDVNASSAHGIWIEDTDSYFIIRNCSVHDGGYGYNYGVYFNNVKNGKIEGVTSYYNDVGIYLENSSNNIISESYASYNVNGIHLQYSSNNTLEECITYYNSMQGIYLSSSSDNNIISNCTFRNNYCGIIIRFSSENNIVSNCDSYNNYHGIYLSDLSDNNRIYHNNFENNIFPAWDECSNCWDNGYPSGGNWWDDYTGWDEYRGENQDVPGSDGIGDTPYYIPGDNNLDRYPLVSRSLKLSISPRCREGMPGAELSYVVAITNTGNVADNYSLTVSDDAGWGPIITPSSLSVYPGGFESATLEVTIPENAENSDSDKIFVVARSQTDNRVSAENSCVALAVIRGVTVSISPSYLSAPPRTEVTYTVTVINTGLVDDTYNLSTMDNGGWGPLVSPSSLSVSVGENVTATLKVTIPENAVPCTEDNITVTAISQADPEVGDNEWCIAHASIGRSVDVLISPREIRELARENVTFSVKVTNTGNIADNYDLIVIDNLGWSPTLDNAWLVVPRNDNRTTMLRVTIPENAEPCTEDNITVIAISRTDPEVSDNDSCIAHVLMPKAELSLVTLYKVGLDVNLWVENGSKLVVKFYKYDNTFQAENVIDEFAPPKHVENIENVLHPRVAEGFPWGTVQIAKLVLTTENTAEVISTLASFTVHQSHLKERFFEILGAWFAHPELHDAFKVEFRDILSQWFSAPP